MRCVFQPLTAVNAGTFSNAKFKDIAAALPVMMASHLITFSETGSGLNFKIARAKD